jgi:ABC-type protease/lipase transport system fused ATPase/permease subunit
MATLIFGVIWLGAILVLAWRAGKALIPAGFLAMALYVGLHYAFGPDVGWWTVTILVVIFSVNYWNYRLRKENAEEGTALDF